jgi:hypothetical protein
VAQSEVQIPVPQKKKKEKKDFILGMAEISTTPVVLSSSLLCVFDSPVCITKTSDYGR